MTDLPPAIRTPIKFAHADIGRSPIFVPSLGRVSSGVTRLAIEALFRVMREKQAECQKAKYVSNEQMRPFIRVMANESSLNNKRDQNKYNSGRIVLYLNRF